MFSSQNATEVRYRCACDPPACGPNQNDKYCFTEGKVGRLSTVSLSQFFTWCDFFYSSIALVFFFLGANVMVGLGFSLPCSRLKRTLCSCKLGKTS